MKGSCLILFLNQEACSGSVRFPQQHTASSFTHLQSGHLGPPCCRARAGDKPGTQMAGAREALGPKVVQLLQDPSKTINHHRSENGSTRIGERSSRKRGCRERNCQTQHPAHPHMGGLRVISDCFSEANDSFLESPANRC